MKKLIQIGLSSVLVFPVMSLGVCAAEWADNTTSMVTYFPVPYAAYNNIYVSDKFDVGTSTGSYNLYLGSSGISNPALEAEQVILHKTDSSTAQFTMDSDVYTPKAYFGNVKSATGSATLDFPNLRLGTQPNIGTLTADSYKVNELNLFGANLGGAACQGTVQIANMNLGDGSKNYMVCCPTGESCGKECYFTSSKRSLYSGYCTTRTFGQKIAGTWCSEQHCSQKCGCQCDTYISTREEVTSGTYKGATYCKPKCETQYWNGTITQCEEQEGSSYWSYSSCKCVCKGTYELDGNTCRPLTWKITRETEKTAKPENGSCPTGQSYNYSTVNGYENGSSCYSYNKTYSPYNVYKNLGVCSDDEDKCCKSKVSATCSVN